MQYNSMEVRIILRTFIVCFGLGSVWPINNLGIKVAISEGKNERGIQENFRSLFDSIGKNEVRKAGTYRNGLEREAAKEQQAFDTMKTELQFARQKTMNRQRNSRHQNSHIGEKASAIKREAHEPGMKTRLDGAITSLKAKLSGLQTGRASSTLLEPVEVNVRGALKPINHLGTISVPEPRLIKIEVWDKSQIVDVEKAILNSGLGLNPSNDGNVIRVPIPVLTEERRRDLMKKVGEYGESAKIAVRNVRRNALKALKRRGKDGDELPENRLRSETKKIQKLTDGYIDDIESIIDRKSKEILNVS